MFGFNNKMLRRNPIAHRQDAGGAFGGYANATARGLAFGLVAGTKIATDKGWRPVETVADGDLILTFDRGLQKVLSVNKGLHWGRSSPCPDHLTPLTVPAGALGNEDQLTLLPEQSVMVESNAAETLFGDPFALITGTDLIGYRGIERRRIAGDLEVIQLHFHDDEIVFTGRGALAFCPGGRMFDIDRLLAEANTADDYYNILPREQARTLVKYMAQEDATSGEMIPEVA